MSYDNNRTEFVVQVRSLFVNEWNGAKYLRVHFVAIDTMTGDDLPKQRRFKTNIQEYQLEGQGEEQARKRFISTVNAFRGCLGMEAIETMGGIKILEQTQREFMLLKQEKISPKVLMSCVINPELKTESFRGQTMVYQWTNRDYWKKEFYPLLNQEVK